MASSHYFCESDSNPVELVEQLAASQDWSFDRIGDDEITLSIAGSWSDYTLSFNWRDDFEDLHLACAFDFKIPPNRRNEVCQLVSRVNAQLWQGHFDVWAEDGGLLYRHGLLLCGGAVANTAQCEAMLSMALEACERFFPAFQYVIWAGKTADEALTAALLETKGSA